MKFYLFKLQGKDGESHNNSHLVEFLELLLNGNMFYFIFGNNLLNHAVVPEKRLIKKSELIRNLLEGS